MALQLAALDADPAAAAGEVIDEGLLFADASSAADDGYYTITPTIAPAGVTTSTRTISTSAPRLMSILTVPAPEAEAPQSEGDIYTSLQTGSSASSAVEGAL